MRKSKYSILIICEGENTEPYLINSIRDGVLSGEYPLDANINLLPEPEVIKEKSVEPKHRSKRKKRKIKKAIDGDEPYVISGVPPLKWVLEGQKQLEEGICNEVWTVFDHDNHPKRQEAFEQAAKEINGKTVNIAFSSLSFEYYLLLHFERIYKKFEKTECKVEKKSILCGTNSHVDDCIGSLCINGYSEVKKYWSSSKGKNSLFPVIKDKIEQGFINSAWVRYKSEIIEGGKAIYNRNPFTSTDLLVKRLLGLDNISHVWMKHDIIVSGLEVVNNETTIFLRNTSRMTILVSADSFFCLGTNAYFGSRVILGYNESYSQNLTDVNGSIGFKFNNNVVLIDID